jgi:hypothetical protein
MTDVVQVCLLANLSSVLFENDLILTHKIISLFDMLMFVFKNIVMTVAAHKCSLSKRSKIFYFLVKNVYEEGVSRDLVLATSRKDEDAIDKLLTQKVTMHLFSHLRIKGR